MPESYIAALDVGTTTIRCFIINSKNETVGSSNCLTKLVYPQPDFCEISPNELWEQILGVVRNALTDAKLSAEDIKCLGISTQRATFTTWCKDTGKTLHNFITWKDMRAKELCKQLNSTLALKSFRWLTYSLHLVSRNPRYLTGSRLQIAPIHVTARLLWVLSHIPDVEEELKNNNVMFGTIDTWLLYKFTKGKLHVTDISNASATAFYDPFVCDWGVWAKNVLKLPQDILPQVVDNDFDFGEIDKEFFGAAIPIKCVMSDQSSSMFASGCCYPEDLKITLGTGAFVDTNTANTIHTSVTGSYPLVGWKINNHITYISESACNDCGSLVEWLINVGMIRDTSETYAMATSVQNSDGVYFVSAFSGLGPPINDPRATSGFLGIKPTTTKNHMVRAVLESIVYRVALAYVTLKNDRKQNYSSVVIDGGVSKNDFICQKLADLTQLRVERLVSTEMSVLGAAYVAGLKASVWSNKGELGKLRKIERVFQPSTSQGYMETCQKEFEQWSKAVERFLLWSDD